MRWLNCSVRPGCKIFVSFLRLPVILTIFVKVNPTAKKLPPVTKVKSTWKPTPPIKVIFIINSLIPITIIGLFRHHPSAFFLKKNIVQVSSTPGNLRDMTKVKSTWKPTPPTKVVFIINSVIPITIIGLFCHHHSAFFWKNYV